LLGFNGRGPNGENHRPVKYLPAWRTKVACLFVGYRASKKKHQTCQTVESICF
jgi:hypothetical protein